MGNEGHRSFLKIESCGRWLRAGAVGLVGGRGDRERDCEKSMVWEQEGALEPHGRQSPSQGTRFS